MYEDSFDTEWTPEDVDREEAVWRAYALGVDAALGTQHSEEYRKLVSATGRSLVEMAYDEGKTAGADLDSRIASGSDTVDDTEFPSREHAVWSKLISYRQNEGGEVGAVGGDDGRDRQDLPEFLYEMDLDSVQKDDLERLRLPDFLSRK